MSKEQNTDVKTAFELLAITLDEEQERIFKAGAKAMEQKNVDVAQTVIDFAKKLQAFQNDVNELKRRWDELRMKMILHRRMFRISLLVMDVCFRHHENGRQVIHDMLNKLVHEPISESNLQMGLSLRIVWPKECLLAQ